MAELDQWGVFSPYNLRREREAEAALKKAPPPVIGFAAFCA